MTELEKLVEGLNQKERDLFVFRSLLVAEDKDVVSCLLNQLGGRVSNPIKMLFEYKCVDGFINLSAERAKEYKDYLDNDSYRRIVVNTAALAEELNCTDPLELSNLYSYLLWNGYFSIGKFRYGNDNAIGCLEYAPHSIMSGVSNNFACSSMLKDILDYREIANAQLVCTNMQKEVSGFVPPFKREGYKEFLVENTSGLKRTLFSKMFGNYHVNLIVDGKGTYIYDPMSLNVFSLQGNNVAFGGSGELELKIKPFLSFAFNGPQNDKVLDHLITADEFYFPYCGGGCWAIRDICIDKIGNDNKALLDDFYDTIYDDIDEVSDGVRYVKKYEQASK